MLAVGKAYEYDGGVPLTTAMDNAKTTVHRVHRYDPDLNREFSLFCSHYGTAPLPTRSVSPKDKNLIKNSLGVFWRGARGRIRSRRFFSLAELNEYLRSLADGFHLRIQRKYGISRREKFSKGEQQQLLELPGSMHESAKWKQAKPHPDCHVQLEYNFYSIPYQYRGKEVEIRYAPTFVEIFQGLEKIACHMKTPQISGDATLPRRATFPLPNKPCSNRHRIWSCKMPRISVQIPTWSSAH